MIIPHIRWMKSPCDELAGGQLLWQTGLSAVGTCSSCSRLEVMAVSEYVVCTGTDFHQPDCN